MEGGHLKREREPTDLQKEVVQVRQDFLSEDRAKNGHSHEALMQRLVDVAADEGLEQGQEYLVNGGGYWFAAKGGRSKRYDSDVIAGRPAVFSHFKTSADTPDDIDIWAVFDLEPKYMPGPHDGYYSERTHRLFIRAASLSFMSVGSFNEVFEDDGEVFISMEPGIRSMYLSSKAADYDALCSSASYKKSNQRARAAQEFRLLHRASVESGIVQRSAVLASRATRIYLPRKNSLDRPYQLIEKPDEPIGLKCIGIDGVSNASLQESEGMANKTLCIGVELDAAVIGFKKRELIPAYIPLLAQHVDLDFGW